MIGKKFIKGQIDEKEYIEAVEWCNNGNNAFIEDKGDYLEVIALPEHVPTADEIQAALTTAVQNWMDKTVQQRNYDNIGTACTYANSTDSTFAAEGLACVKWRDAVWRKCYDMLAEVKAGTRAIPTADEVIAELPALEW